VTRPASDGGPAAVGAISGELNGMAGPDLGSYHAVFDAVLSDALDKDPYVCAPTPRSVFFGAAPEGARVIRGSMPHYGLYFGPMGYLVRRVGDAWRVEVNVAVEPPPGDATLLLPDCALEGQLDGELACNEPDEPYAWESEVCPGGRVFGAKATRRSVRALLSRWSTEVERYFNRDARLFGLPVTYDFEFVLADESSSRVDITLPLAPSCARTPYFSSLQAGWSLPVIAHEIGHVLGLLDEFEDIGEALGISYVTPSGLELSRMGESRKEASRVLPLHHYLVLRRYLCPEPRQMDPYTHAL
jgi:hypothetical protein